MEGLMEGLTDVNGCEWVEIDKRYRQACQQLIVIIDSIIPLPIIVTNCCCLMSGSQGIASNSLHCFRPVTLGIVHNCDIS